MGSSDRASENPTFAISGIANIGISGFAVLPDFQFCRKAGFPVLRDGFSNYRKSYFLQNNGCSPCKERCHRTEREAMSSQGPPVSTADASAKRLGAVNARRDMPANPPPIESQDSLLAGMNIDDMTDALAAAPPMQGEASSGEVGSGPQAAANGGAGSGNARTNPCSEPASPRTRSPSATTTRSPTFCLASPSRLLAFPLPSCSLGIVVGSPLAGRVPAAGISSRALTLSSRLAEASAVETNLASPRLFSSFLLTRYRSPSQVAFPLPGYR